jgi:hypothetical protein
VALREERPTKEGATNSAGAPNHHLEEVASPKRCDFGFFPSSARYSWVDAINLGLHLECRRLSAGLPA